MQIASFDAILTLLEDLDPWLISLGIRPKNDRWHEAIKMVARAKAQRRSIEHGGQRKFIDNYIPGLFDEMEIHEIVRAYAGRHPRCKKKFVGPYRGLLPRLASSQRTAWLATRCSSYHWRRIGRMRGSGGAR